jgi:hypothetical protein
MTWFESAAKRARDRVVSTFSALILLYAGYNPWAEIYAHYLPPLTLMMVLQLLWCNRLTRHAVRRGFYDIKGEDYRYTIFRRIVPAIPPRPSIRDHSCPTVLLLSLSLPMHAVLIHPPSEFSSQPIPSHSIPLGTILAYLPKRLHSTNPSTPIFNFADLSLALLALTLLYIEHRTDETMYAYQTVNHSKSRSDLIHPKPPKRRTPASWPQPTTCPKEFHWESDKSIDVKFFKYCEGLHTQVAIHSTTTEVSSNQISDILRRFHSKSRGAGGTLSRWRYGTTTQRVVRSLARKGR